MSAATTTQREEYLDEIQVAAQYPLFTVSSLRDNRYGRGVAPLIPYIKIGAKVRYRRSDIEAYIDHCRITPSGD